MLSFEILYSRQDVTLAVDCTVSVNPRRKQNVHVPTSCQRPPSGFGSVSLVLVSRHEIYKTSAAVKN
jgi:hypothetical protein